MTAAASITASVQKRLKIVLTAVDRGLFDAWTEFCDDLEDVTVHRGSIFDVKADAVVSPANSFGFMDGGIDALYVDRFGAAVEDRVRRAILQHHAGELLVGAADIVETGAAQHFLIAAPTMCVPMILGARTVNPYLATRAVLLLIRDSSFRSGPFIGEKVSDHVRVVAFPGMGTGVGRVPPETCARQVRMAIEEFVGGTFRFPTSWAEASERHQVLYTDQPVRLQYQGE